MKKFLIVLLVAVVALYYVYTEIIVGSAETQDDISTVEWSTDHIEDIPVALDVTPSGRVYVAETGQFMSGVGDNRYQAFWLADDMLSESLADRKAYVDAAVTSGELEPSWFDNADTLRTLFDSDGDGKADQSTVFAKKSGRLDGVMSGVLATDDGVLVTNIPRVYRYRDTDGDNVADQEDVLSEGYGVRTAFVGHDLHGLTWGPDGRIYFSVGDRGFNIDTLEGNNLQAPMDQGRGGVFRMQPDGSELELYAWGLRNPQELAFDNYGNLITGDNNSDGGDAARIVYVVEGGDSGWTYGYQYMEEEDYLRGPWNAERMWEPYHEGQPAWIVPPLANETNGPSGLAFYPGLGLPDRYEDHFFLSNYSFVASGSWILSFKLEPKGAGFEVENVHKFASNELFVDQTFGYDGKMYSISGSVFTGNKVVRQFFAKDKQDDPAIAESARLLSGDIKAMGDDELVRLLGHKDQRVRLKSQYLLAERNSAERLNAVALSQDADELERIHALWGLGQIGQAAFVDWQNFDAFSGELLAQALKVSAEADASALRKPAREMLAHSNARVRYFAAMAVGRFADVEALDSLIAAINDNNNRDPFLRHAHVMALHGMNSAAALDTVSAHSNAAVRLVGVLAQRRRPSARLATYLNDSDARVVTEAARAVHDLRVYDAMPALAALATTKTIVNTDEAQSSLALHRRIINANLLLGGAGNASALAAYAADESKPHSMRALALQTLKEFTAPPVADKVWGDHLIMKPRPNDLVDAALDEWLPSLMDSDFADEALALGLRYDRVALSEQELLALVIDESMTATRRSSALQALAAKDQGDILNTAIEKALQSEADALAITAASVLGSLDTERAVRFHLETVGRESASFLRQQNAIRALGELATEPANTWLTEALKRYELGALEAELQLDVMEASLASKNATLKSEADKVWAKQTAQGAVQARRLAMLGGNAENGKQVFDNRGDCLRCHSVAQRGGVAGPALDGLATRYDNDYIYRALVDPGADMAPGFATVALQLQDGTSMAGILLNETADIIRMQADGGHGDVSHIDIPTADVKSKQGPFSGMPPLGLTLELQDLRDLMAYLQSLR